MNLGVKQLVFEHTTVVAVKDQVSSDLAGEAVILNLKSGVYYGLNEVGARIWQLLQEPRTVAAIRDTLLEEYEIDRDGCDRDLLALLQELGTAEIIEVNHEATA
jgi:hypothetical protein